MLLERIEKCDESFQFVFILKRECDPSAAFFIAGKLHRCAEYRREVLLENIVVVGLCGAFCLFFGLAGFGRFLVGLGKFFNIAHRQVALQDFVIEF